MTVYRTALWIAVIPFHVVLWLAKWILIGVIAFMFGVALS